MFDPTKTWRRWHRKVNRNQRRYALTSALAASAIPALVMARGHRIEQVSEIPLVLSNESVQSITKTKQAQTLLKTLKAFADVERVKDSRQIRRGKGKMRDRRYTQRKGPLVIYNSRGPLVTAFRNLPGVDLVSVTRLNLLQLAPGGHVGRFCIWTKDAFEKLEDIYGNYRRGSSSKTGYTLARPMLTNSDITRVINSDEVQSQCRPTRKASGEHTRKKNPLKNLGAMVKLNPFVMSLRRREIKFHAARRAKKAALVEKHRKGEKVTHAKQPPKNKAMVKSLLAP